RGPWGQGPSKGPSGGRGQNPPDLDEIIKKSQERLKDIIPGGGGAGSGVPWLIILVAISAVWLYNSFYRVQPDEQGVVLRFGEYSRTTGPGLHFALWPAETVETPPVLRENNLNFGGTGQSESLMLAGDQNIVDIRFTVQWRIKDAREYLFNVRDQEELVVVVAESAMREVVGRTRADQIRTRGRFEAQQQVRELIQATLDSYGAGITINGVQLEKADPPPQVLDAFEEVQRAEQNQNKFIREAEQYRNKLLGQARGEASKILEDAKAYRARVVAEAEGEASRFEQVYAEYAKAKDVTRKRMFLETLEGVLAGSNKIIIENSQGGGSDVVPYLPLPEVQKRVKQSGDQ
ncbi:MAG: FtsH protease activity modulator HflK, partial [Aestuariivirgaceae bacterium]